MPKPQSERERLLALATDKAREENVARYGVDTVDMEWLRRQSDDMLRHLAGERRDGIGVRVVDARSVALSAAQRPTAPKGGKAA